MWSNRTIPPAPYLMTPATTGWVVCNECHAFLDMFCQKVADVIFPLLNATAKPLCMSDIDNVVKVLSNVRKPPPRSELSAASAVFDETELIVTLHLRIKSLCIKEESLVSGRHLYLLLCCGRTPILPSDSPSLAGLREERDLLSELANAKHHYKMLLDSSGIAIKLWPADVDAMERAFATNDATSTDDYLSYLELTQGAITSSWDGFWARISQLRTGCIKYPLFSHNHQLEIDGLYRLGFSLFSTVYSNILNGLQEYIIRCCEVLDVDKPEPIEPIGCLPPVEAAEHQLSDGVTEMDNGSTPAFSLDDYDAQMLLTDGKEMHTLFEVNALVKP